MNKLKNFWNNFWKNVENKMVESNDLEKLETNITHQLFNGQVNKLSTNESILLFEKINDNFVRVIKNRERSAIEELEIINKFKTKNNI